MQALLVPVGFPGIIDVHGFHLNFYTSPSFLSIAIYLILIWLVIFKFNEYVVFDNKNADKYLSINSSGRIKLKKKKNIFLFNLKI